MKIVGILADISINFDKLLRYMETQVIEKGENSFLGKNFKNTIFLIERDSAMDYLLTQHLKVPLMVKIIDSSNVIYSLDQTKRDFYNNIACNCEELYIYLDGTATPLTGWFDQELAEDTKIYFNKIL